MKVTNLSKEKLKKTKIGKHFFFFFVQFALSLTIVEGTLVRKNSRFSWFFAHLFVPLT